MTPATMGEPGLLGSLLLDRPGLLGAPPGHKKGSP